MEKTVLADKVVREARFDYKYRENMSPEQIVAMFNDFAVDYDEDAFTKHSCMSAVVIAEYLDKYYSSAQRSKLKVLDVAAGTGALGSLLKRAGFVNMDALDPADKMLEVARSKKIYQRHICEYINGRRNPGIETDFYDLLTVSDGFNIGLIPLKAFSEIVRVVKPVCCSCKRSSCVYNSWRSIELGYKGDFFPLLLRLVDEGVWEKVVHLRLEDGRVSYKGSGPGTLFAYRVKVSEMTSCVV